MINSTLLLDKITKMAEEKQLHKIKDINQSFKTGFHVSGEESDYCITTLLGLAAYKGDFFLVNALVEAGADVNTPMTGYRQLYMPIHQAIYGSYHKKDEDKAFDDRVKIIDLLHENGADLNWSGNDLYSWTPLAVADWLNNAPILGVELLRVGADPTVPSSIPMTVFGSSFLELACQEAKNKYESIDGYKIPQGLHSVVSNKLETMKFKYSTEIKKLVTVDMEVQNGSGEGTHIWEHKCYNTEVNPSHTDVFDLSEVEFVGSVSIEDLFNSLGNETL